jgi:hypothetical protein
MAVETTIVREAPFLEDKRKQLLSSAQSLSGQAITLPRQSLAPFSGTTQQAFDAAQTGLGAYQPYLTSAGQQFTGAEQALTGAGQQLAGSEGILANLAARPTAALDEARMAALVGAGDITGRIQDFQNPYQQQVIDVFNLEAERQGDIARQRAADVATRTGAFGGSRAGVQAAELERNLADVKQRNLANLLSGGFTQALGGAEREAARLQQLPGQLMGIEQLQYQLPGQVAQNLGQAGANRQNLAGGQQSLGGAYSGLAGLAQQLPAQDIALLSQVGSQQQQQAQRALDLERQNILQQTYEPYQRIGYYSDILKGQPSAQSTLQTSSDPRTNPLSQMLGAGISLAGIFGPGGFGQGYLFKNPGLGAAAAAAARG